jgi:hypothetical protein
MIRRIQRDVECTHLFFGYWVEERCDASKEGIHPPSMDSVENVSLSPQKIYSSLTYGILTTIARPMRST